MGWFTDEEDAYEPILLSCTAGRWDLLVFPPETSAAAAARLDVHRGHSRGPHRRRSDDGRGHRP
ncbi:hypothetical protein [Streptomyces sp. NPDC059909]|uniref:hypothetical protein n=1 Tax=Streptomyces sp. NPDC059909 TaxID=3346998 RepID=UPI003652DBDF